MQNDNSTTITLNDAHHGVGSSTHPEMIFSCRFSFIAPKKASKEDRMASLCLFFNDITERVDEAFRNEGLP